MGLLLDKCPDTKVGPPDLNGDSNANEAMQQLVQLAAPGYIAIPMHYLQQHNQQPTQEVQDGRNTEQHDRG